MADQNSPIDMSFIEKGGRLQDGKAVGLILKAKLFRVTLEVKTIVHRFMVHDNAVEAGRKAAAAEGLGVFGEGALSSVTPIEVKDVTNSALYGALTGEGEK